MSEVLQMEGRLARLKREATALESAIRGDLKAVRSLLDPFVDDLVDLDTDAAASQALELAQKRIQLVEKRARIREIEKALGR